VKWRERALAGELLNRSPASLFVQLKAASAEGRPRTLETLASLQSPLAELGYLVYSGALEVTPTGAAQLLAWKSRRNIRE